MSTRHFIPELELQPWHPWFAWHPVKLKSGRWAWLRRVERRKFWFVFFMREYR